LRDSAQTVNGAPGETVTLKNAIISGVEGPCVFNDDSNDPSALQVSYSNLHACGESGTEYATNAALLQGMMHGDPLFVDLKNGDLHLNSASPLIDAGMSGVENCEHFKNEPKPNGCAANLGAYGNTDEAATKAGAPHCECPAD
jgi:hypothetical protein